MSATGVDIFGDEVAIDSYELPRAWGGGSLNYAAMSTEELIRLANAEASGGLSEEFEDDRVGPQEVAEDDGAIVLRMANALGRKFEVGDIANTGAQGMFLYEFAEAWVQTQKDAGFEWLRDIARKYKARNGLSNAVAKGVLNCYVAEARRSDPRERPEGDSRWIRVNDADSLDLAKNDEEIAHAEAYAAYVAEQTAEEVAQGFYTIVNADGSRLTIKVSKWLDDDRRPGRKIRFVSMLVGPDNTSDYQCFARQGDDHRLPTVSQKYRNGHGRWISAMMALFDGAAAEAQMAYAVESGKCARCNRLLTVPGWEDRMGLGPECYKKVGI